MNSTQNFAVIVAGGKGLRMGSKIKKQYLMLDGIPVLARTLKTFDTCRVIDEIILVVPEEDFHYCSKHILSPHTFSKPVEMVAGGNQRQDSVLNGLKKAAELKDASREAVVLIHDGVRPFVGQEIIENCIRGAQKCGACLPVIPMTDTVKKAESDDLVKETLPRESLYCAQTPQVFSMEIISQAFDYAKKTNFTATDDASLVEHLGKPVIMVKGSKFNIKLTSPEDLDLGRFILSRDI